MKTRTLIVVVVIIMAVFTLTGSGEKKTTIDESTMLEVMSGTWVNPDYNKEIYAAKIIVNPDGSYDLYRTTDSDQRAWYGDFTSIEAWTDSEGTYWYKATFEENWAYTAYYELGKIDSAKSVWEWLFYSLDFPDEWDPDNIRYEYRIWYRQ